MLFLSLLLNLRLFHLLWENFRFTTECIDKLLVVGSAVDGEGRPGREIFLDIFYQFFGCGNKSVVPLVDFLNFFALELESRILGGFYGHLDELRGHLTIEDPEDRVEKFLNCLSVYSVLALLVLDILEG